MAEQKALHDRLQQQKEEKIKAQQLERDQQEAAYQATVKDLLQKHEATVAQLDAVRLQHGEAIQQIKRNHTEETSRLKGIISGLEDRNKELVEAVDVMRETTSRNILKIAEVVKALMLETISKKASSGAEGLKTYHMFNL